LTIIQKKTSLQIHSNTDNSIVTTTHPNGMIRRQHYGSSIEHIDVDEASYIYCSEAKQITKGSSKAPVVGFLVPTNFLNGTSLIFENDKERPPLVQITCSVMDIYPVYPIDAKKP